METKARKFAKPTAAGPSGTAYDAALRYLGNRPRSVSEIHRHLRGKKFDDEAIAAAIDKLRAQRYVDDDAFARYWLEQRERFRPRGDRGIRMELAQKGVSREESDAFSLRSADKLIKTMAQLSGRCSFWIAEQPNTYGYNCNHHHKQYPKSRAFVFQHILNS